MYMIICTCLQNCSQQSANDYKIIKLMERPFQNTMMSIYINEKTNGIHVKNKTVKTLTVN